jgi:rod shape determining protein RodA
VFERRLYHHIDWALVIAVLALCAFGVVTIYSATFDPTRGASHRYVVQIYAIGLGLLAMLVMLTVDYRAFTDKSHLVYIAIIAVLAYVLVFGHEGKGARRWIPIGSFNLQPSEFAKISVALVLAKFFGENRGAPQWTDLAIGGVLAALPLALIAKEPDLGTAVTLLPIFLAVAYLAGMQMRILGVLLIAFVLAAPVAWKFALKDYQKSRISTFLDPSQDA